MEINGLGDEDDVERTSNGLAEESERLKKRGHECPVPKPGGIVGKVLGLGQRDDRLRGQRSEVVVERERIRDRENGGRSEP